MSDTKLIMLGVYRLLDAEAQEKGTYWAKLITDEMAARVRGDNEKKES